MKQFTYVLGPDTDFSLIAEEIESKLRDNSGAKSIIEVIEPTGKRELFEDSLKKTHQRFPETEIYGMTSQGPILAKPELGEEDNRKALCSLMIFEESGAIARGYDCHIHTAKEAGALFVEELKEISDLKGILMMSSDIRLFSDDFAQVILQEYPEVPIFGAMAGSQDIAKDYSLVFKNDEIFGRGIVAVAFYGKNLHITTKNSLGWRPLGKEFTITKSSEDGFVHEIDGKPAMDLYRDCLGVVEDKYFYENTAAFPLLFMQNGKIAGRVALYANEGSVLFTMPIPEGTRASFAYARKKYLLGESLKNANDMIAFNPEAVLVFSCMTRRSFMGDVLAEKEFAYYKNVCPSCIWTGGYGEFMYSEDGAGLLNGTLIAIGFREGDNVKTSSAVPMMEPETENKKDQILPLMERMINLLEKTTDELRENNEQLVYFANHDALTGINNRASFNSAYKEMMENLGDDGTLSLIMMDIDHFKQVNDNYGHDVGDDVLKKVVKYIKPLLPVDAVFCRWGGEELICLISEQSKEDSMALAESIRDLIEKSDFSPVPKLTISVGVSIIDKNITERKEAIKKVDSALYEAKETGRNKVVLRE